MNDKYIYVLGDFKQCADVNSVDIYRENIDGTGERIINSVEGVQLVVDAYIYDDMIVFTYLNTLDLADINNPVDLDTPVGGLVCYDISTDKFIKHEVPVYDDNACEAIAGYVSKIMIIFCSWDYIVIRMVIHTCLKHGCLNGTLPMIR